MCVICTRFEPPLPCFLRLMYAAIAAIVTTATVVAHALSQPPIFACFFPAYLEYLLLNGSLAIH